MNTLNKKILYIVALLLSLSGFSQTKFPTTVEGDFLINNFQFTSKEMLPQLNIHYTTVGTPIKDKNGHIANAVLIMHGTTGDGHAFLSEQFAGKLFNTGQLLDAAKYFIILPDAIGHGKSSKPSNGLHMKFPVYNYDDMVKANYLLLTQHFGIQHMRLIMGTSMGGMQTWVWAYTYPDFMDALMPLASLPIEIAGRNRIQRKMAINLIEMDPAWKNGEYTAQPIVGLTGAISSLIFMTSSPWQWQHKAPNRMASDSMLAALVTRYRNSLDANDFIYQFDASRDYNPLPHLTAIKAPLFAVNSADDQVNPPELKVLDTAINKVKKGKYILLPITDKTNGHGTHSIPAIWGNYLKELLELTEHKN